MAKGKYKKWRMENGEWRMENEGVRQKAKGKS
jgi:hypothetical protein